MAFEISFSGTFSSKHEVRAATLKTVLQFLMAEQPTGGLARRCRNGRKSREKCFPGCAVRTGGNLTLRRKPAGSQLAPLSLFNKHEVRSYTVKTVSQLLLFASFAVMSVGYDGEFSCAPF